jgi:dTDP-4-dehydrorhamnose reductase
MPHAGMHVVVTGAAGRLGAPMASALVAAGHRVSALTRADVDVTNDRAVDAVVTGLHPDIIINCTAYNAVDAAEADPASAFAVNAQAPAALAAAATRVGALLAHYSTDFVFDGAASEPYSEDAPTRPLSVYGASKLAGDREAAAAAHHYILRVESLFGGHAGEGKKATVDLIADNLQAGLVVKALVDRTVSLSYVRDVVRATTMLIDRAAPFGVYHCVTSGATTWYALAEEIARHGGYPARLVPVRSDEFQTVAPRPRFCALSNEKLINLGIEMPGWCPALHDHLASRAARQASAEADSSLRAGIA